MSIFRSKVDTWLVAVIVGVVVICIAPIVLHPLDWAVAITAVFALVILTFVIDTLFNITYVIDGKTLTVRSGRLFRGTAINIGDIKAIETTHTLLSAPAASLDRLRIRMGKYDEVVISPKRKQEFIDALLKVNPDIEV